MKKVQRKSLSAALFVALVFGAGSCFASSLFADEASSSSPSSAAAAREVSTSEETAASETTETRAKAGEEEHPAAGETEVATEPASAGARSDRPAAASAETDSAAEMRESASPATTSSATSSKEVESAPSSASETSSGKPREERAAGDEAETRRASDDEKTGFFDKDGKTYYRDPASRELLKNGIYRLQGADGALREYVFAQDAALVKANFFNLSASDRVYAEADGSLREGEELRTIGTGSYVLRDGRVLLNDWYTDPNGKRCFAAPGTGQLYRRGAFTVKDGKRYAFDQDGRLVLDDWIDEPGYGRSYGRPGTGEVYSQGAFTLKDGKRYAFNRYGLLAKGEWVDEPGYGRSYGRPGTGEVYSQGAFSLPGGKRYAFNRYGLLAKGEWVDEPGYGRSYGRPGTGEVYSQGAYTVLDGKRYVFNRYGILAKGEWVDEAGYGRAYGAPDSGLAYRGGAFGIIQNGKKTLYVFNPDGYLSSGWEYEEGYGWTYAENDHKAFYSECKVIDGVPYVFNASGYLAAGVVKDRHSEYYIGGTIAPLSRSDRKRGVALDTVSYLIGDEWCAFDSKGHHTPRNWGGKNGELSINGERDFLRVSIKNQVMYLVRDGKILAATPVVTGNVVRGWATPVGHFRILNKAKNQTLMENSYVFYWMPFTYLGHGVHDANEWRSTYGADYYYYGGSHGCVNTPINIMPLIYEKSYVGMSVYVYAE